MNAEQLHEILHRLEGGLDQARQAELAAEDALAGARDERLRQEGRVGLTRNLLQMMQAQEAQGNQGVQPTQPETGDE